MGEGITTRIQKELTALQTSTENIKLEMRSNHEKLHLELQQYSDGKFLEARAYADACHYEVTAKLNQILSLLTGKQFCANRVESESGKNSDADHEKTDFSMSAVGDIIHDPDQESARRSADFDNKSPDSVDLGSNRNTAANTTTQLEPIEELQQSAGSCEKSSKDWQMNDRRCAISDPLIEEIKSEIEEAVDRGRDLSSVSMIETAKCELEKEVIGSHVKIIADELEIEIANYEMHEWHNPCDRRYDPEKVTDRLIRSAGEFDLIVECGVDSMNVIETDAKFFTVTDWRKEKERELQIRESGITVFTDHNCIRFVNLSSEAARDEHPEYVGQDYATTVKSGLHSVFINSVVREQEIPAINVVRDDVRLMNVGEINSKSDVETNQIVCATRIAAKSDVDSISNIPVMIITDLHYQSDFIAAQISDSTMDEGEREDEFDSESDRAGASLIVNEFGELSCDGLYKTTSGMHILDDTGSSKRVLKIESAFACNSDASTNQFFTVELAVDRSWNRETAFGNTLPLPSFDNVFHATELLVKMPLRTVENELDAIALKLNVGRLLATNKGQILFGVARLRNCRCVGVLAIDSSLFRLLLMEQHCFPMAEVGRAISDDFVVEGSFPHGGVPSTIHGICIAQSFHSAVSSREQCTVEIDMEEHVCILQNMMVPDSVRGDKGQNSAATRDSTSNDTICTANSASDADQIGLEVAEITNSGLEVHDQIEPDVVSDFDSASGDVERNVTAQKNTCMLGNSDSLLEFHAQQREIKNLDRSCDSKSDSVFEAVGGSVEDQTEVIDIEATVRIIVRDRSGIPDLIIDSGAAIIKVDSESTKLEVNVEAHSLLLDLNVVGDRNHKVVDEVLESVSQFDSAIETTIRNDAASDQRNGSKFNPRYRRLLFDKGRERFGSDRVAILARRMTKRGNKAMTEVLIQWSNVSRKISNIQCLRTNIFFRWDTCYEPKYLGTN